MGRVQNFRRQKMIKQEGRCYYCQTAMWDARKSETTARRLPKHLQCTAEHLKPRSEGGADTLDNIVAACLFCNRTRHRQKKVRSPMEYREFVTLRIAKGKWPPRLAGQVRPVQDSG